MKRILRIALLITLALGVLALVGCSSASSGGSSSTPPASGGSSSSGGASGGGAASGGTAVTIANFAFSPSTLTVKVGDKVTWTNNDSTTHTVTSDNGAFDSGPINPGASYSFTFTKAGSFSYHCSIHPSMTAQVTVQ